MPPFMSDDRGALSLLAQALSPWQLGLSSKCQRRRESTIVHFDGSLLFSSHRQSNIIHHQTTCDTNNFNISVSAFNIYSFLSFLHEKLIYHGLIMVLSLPVIYWIYFLVSEQDVQYFKMSEFPIFIKIVTHKFCLNVHSVMCLSVMFNSLSLSIFWNCI